MPDPADAMARVLYPDATLVPIADEPGWAHVWATTPDGIYQPIADFHLPCRRAKAFTQRQGDGTTRHFCRACAIDAAIAKEGS